VVASSGHLQLGVGKPAATRSRRFPATHVVLGLLILAGAVLRLWGLGFGLPHTQARPDETQVMGVTLDLLRGNFWPHFYDYPRIYNYLLLLSYLGYFVVGWVAGTFASVADLVASWPVKWAPFFLIDRGLAAAAGILTIPVVFQLGRASVSGAGTPDARQPDRLGLRGEAVGLVSAAFLALAFLHGRESHFGTTDTMLVLFCAMSVTCLLKSEKGSWARWELLAAVTAGLAAGTKYNGVVLLLPIAVSQLWHAYDLRRVAAVADRRAWTMAAAFVLVISFAVPFVIFDFAAFRDAMRDMQQVLTAGLMPRQRVNGWWYHFAISLRYGLGLPLLAAGLAGAVVVASRSLRTATLLLAFPIAYFVVAGSLGAQFVRYALPVVPFACVTAAVAVCACARWLAPAHRVRRTVLMVLLAAAVVYPSASRLVAFDRVMAQTDSRVVASDWIARHAQPGASVVVSGSPYGSPQISLAFETWPWDRQLRVFTTRQRQPVTGRPDWILLQESPLPSMTQDVVNAWLTSGYERLTTIRAFDPAVTNNLYDRQDAFFVPFSAFDGVRRPGSNFTIYRLPSARYVSSPAHDREY
jgi:4-amino-4-deoxy-L-arabinose transferase-like glycosyltransferase